MSTPDLGRAAEFLTTHARLLERRLAALHGGTGDAHGVLDALAAYRNPGGGLGHALEPDVRAPDSQPLAVDFGLEVVEQVLDSPAGHDPEVRGRARELAAGLLPYLAEVAAPGGGLPIVLPSAAGHPRAAHWGDCRFPPGLNPTGNIVARLRMLGLSSTWLDAAESFCRGEIDALVAAADPPDAHTAGNAWRYLRSAPDRAWAERRSAQLADRMAAMPLLHLHPGEGYGLTPLDLAPTPDHPLRPLFPAGAVAAHLTALGEAQQPDGGWPLAWQPPGPAAVLEWRGVVTGNALRVLTAHDR
ncbi:hypothetical protein SAMN05421810_11293 [Amycolatopsis arida]|uniref:Uncharacterized protein n=1 Tax=Amycolatopsis arida TaxID=587909 RepID=A0A1I6AG35_9PSEU|nr:hypothetical protein [Amycolatopsis arida]TDX97714.1 hypothetical protein CLV69_102820 [Amycolatopsis arida]SFQ67678.1 hypothetical protein SAMN05421810_11293 [Amycolatopsis arida]